MPNFEIFEEDSDLDEKFGNIEPWINCVTKLLEKAGEVGVAGGREGLRLRE